MTIQTSRFLVTLACFAGAFLTSAQPSLTNHYSLLHVRLGIREGYIATLRGTNGSWTEWSEPFQGVSKQPTGTAERILLDQVDAALHNLGPAFVLCLPDQFRTNYPTGLPPSIDIASVQTLTTNEWRGADSHLLNWSRDIPELQSNPVRNLRQVFGDLIARPDHIQPAVATNLSNSPLVWEPAPPPPPGITPRERLKYDPPLNGLLNFRIVHVSATDLAPSRIRLEGHQDFLNSASVTPDHLSRLLRPLVGELWSRRSFKRILDDYFIRMGYAVADKPERGQVVEMVIEPIRPLSSSEQATIRIESPPKLSRLVVEISLTNAPPLKRALYAALNTAAFSDVHRHRETLLQPYPSLLGTNRSATTLSLLSNNAALLPDLNRFVVARDAQAQAAALASAGFQSSYLPASESGSRPSVALRLVPLQSSDSDADAPTDSLSTQHRPNRLQFGIAYSAKQPLRYDVVYSRTPLTETDSISALAGYQREVFGGLAFHKDFLAFTTLGRRLSLSASGQSDFQADRLIDGMTVDERRTGGSLRGEWDLLRNLSGSSLRLDGGGGYHETEYLENGARLGRDAITTLDLGLRYVWVRNGTRSSPALELEPRGLTGYSQTNGGWYLKPTLLATWHQLLPAFLEWHSRGTVAWSTPDTPIGEQPRFGGQDSVRGFRADAGLGRFAWSAQNEIWIPIRFGAAWPENIDRFVRRNIQCAVFFDVGGVEKTPDDFSGIHAGAGLGLRVTLKSVTFQLDWAHALGHVERKRGGSTFYFGASLRPMSR